MSEIRATASAGPIALVDGAPPKRIQLLKIGANPARDGRITYRVDDQAHAEAIVAASRAYAGATEPMIDYDHQSVFGAKDGVGGRAPAAGWMGTLVADAEGIWADPVEWTAAAAQALAAREYRYISPYFGHDASGRVTRIFNAALTNRPELELQAVASQEDPSPMDQIIQVLGLAAGATPEQVLAAITSLQGDRVAMCSALGLGANATLGEFRTAASAAGRVDITQYVPRAEFDRVRAEVDAITETRVTASVDAAIAAGKVAPASRDWALGYAKKDEAGFASFVGTAPAIVQEGAEQRRAAAIAADTLTTEEKAVCSQMGITPEDFLASRKKGMTA